jgi:hypothetical protein
MALMQPVLQMVSSDFVGRKEDSATIRRGGTGLFPDSCVARRLRMLIRALLAPWTRRRSRVRKTPSVRRTTLVGEWVGLGTTDSTDGHGWFLKRGGLGWLSLKPPVRSEAPAGRFAGQGSSEYVWFWA